MGTAGKQPVYIVDPAIPDSKIDDKDFAATNHGVWCHNLHDLLGRDKFTSWDQYGKDEIIK